MRYAVPMALCLESKRESLSAALSVSAGWTTTWYLTGSTDGVAFGWDGRGVSIGNISINQFPLSSLL